MLTIIVGVACFIAGALIGIERFRTFIKYVKEKLFGKPE
jgi:uncharacterized protein YneF (UPF0154 family)